MISVFQVGRTTFVELFSSYPDTKNVFRQFRAADERVLRTGSDLLQHGQIVMTLVQRVVRALPDYEAIWEILVKAGRNHFSKGKTFAMAVNLSYSQMQSVKLCPPSIRSSRAMILIVRGRALITTHADFLCYYGYN